MLPFSAVRHHITRWPPVDYLLTRMQHADVGPDDGILGCYPRSGSTWLRFILYELLTGRETSFELVDQTLADIGHHGKAPRLLPNGGRFLKTHEPYRAEYHRAIYLVRDVRDVVISEYAFCRRERLFEGDFDHFFEAFIRGRINRYGFWGDHVRSWLDYAQSNPGQVLLIRFEDMRRDTVGVVDRCLQHFGVTQTQAEITVAVEHHTLKRMQEKEDAANKFNANAHGLRFVTDGQVGKGKQQLSTEQLTRLTRAADAEMKRLRYA